jgi:glutathione S-transferase
MKFYDCATAPSPRRVRIFIAEKGLDIETIQVDLAAGEHLSDAFRKLNPQCTVPVLELDDGTCLIDSISISLYLDETYPEPNLMGRNAREKAVISMWQREMDSNGFLAVGECFRNRSKGLTNRALTGPVAYAQIPELAERGRLRTRQFFNDLDKRLAGSEYIAGERFTIADITAVVAVDFAKWIKEFIPDDAVHLKRWYETVSVRPGVVG